MLQLLVDRGVVFVVLFCFKLVALYVAQADLELLGQAILLPQIIGVCCSAQP